MNCQKRRRSDAKSARLLASSRAIRSDLLPNHHLCRGVAHVYSSSSTPFVGFCFLFFSPYCASPPPCNFAQPLPVVQFTGCCCYSFNHKPHHTVKNVCTLLFRSFIAPPSNPPPLQNSYAPKNKRTFSASLTFAIFIRFPPSAVLSAKRSDFSLSSVIKRSFHPSSYVH